MCLSKELFTAINQAKASVTLTERFARLEADLADFVTSPTLDPQYLKSLYPARDGVWAIRGSRPKPSIRVLGLFAAKNKFIATNYAMRSDLGEFESNEWRIERRRAKTIWRQLFPSYDFIPGRDVNKLFSGAINERYFQR